MTPAPQAIHPVMVGTAGHIDHGKSSLVRALTGIDPDRLKEEKERGLTIDLGFAPLPLPDGRLIGMVDVPGHERFIRNMVAGSTALDLAILVVAADDSVMPQTLEHLDILDVLGVERGVVALTKVDLVDEEIAALAQEEVEELVAGSRLAGAPLVRVSSVTGEGIEELRTVLTGLAATIVPRSPGGAFRMPIQRVFQLKGIGVVVTGIPLSGAVSPGDSLTFLPGGHSAKVRAVQAFGGQVERAVAGHSTALSVPDARAAGLRRGTVAATPGIFQTGDAVDLELSVLPRTTTLEHRCDVRLHTGTSEARGMLLLLERDRVSGGENVIARVVLSEDICCAPGDRFLLRLQNPSLTIGGGTVVRLTQTPKRYRRRVVGEELQRLRAAGSDPEGRLIEEITLAGAAGLVPAELAARLAMDVEQVSELLQQLDPVHVHPRGGRAFTTAVLEAGIEELHASVERMLRAKPLAASVRRASFRPTRELPERLIDAVIDELQRRGKVRAGTQGQVLFVDRLQALPPADQARLDRLIAACDQRGFRPATRDQLAEELAESVASLDSLLARAGDEGLVDRVGDHIYGGTTLRRALQAIRDNCLRHDDELDIPELRDELGTSRKFLIPLLEYVDGLGLTRLRSGVRCLLRSSTVFAELE